MLRPRSLPRILGIAIIPIALLAAACGVTTVGGGGAGGLPTATPVPSCATLVPGSSAATTITGFSDVPFPTGAVNKGPTNSYGGAGQFTISEYDVCFTGTTDQVVGPFSAHNSVSANLLGEGWGTATTFPYTGALQQSCTSHCYQTENTKWVAFENITDHGGGLITYHMRLAAPPAAPTCNSNFASSPIQGYQLKGQFDVPLPPLTRVVPDDAAGGLRGEDLCSAGTAASVTAFLNAALPADGWTHVASDPRCFYAAQCWTKGGNAISWNVTSATLWNTAYRQPIG
jgi:hypothetical protein